MRMPHNVILTWLFILAGLIGPTRHQFSRMFFATPKVSKNLKAKLPHCLTSAFLPVLYHRPAPLITRSLSEHILDRSPLGPQLGTKKIVRLNALPSAIHQTRSLYISRSLQWVQGLLPKPTTPLTRYVMMTIFLIGSFPIPIYSIFLAF